MFFSLYQLYKDFTHFEFDLLQQLWLNRSNLQLFKFPHRIGENKTEKGFFKYIVLIYVHALLASFKLFSGP